MIDTVGGTNTGTEHWPVRNATCDVPQPPDEVSRSEIRTIHARAGS